MAAHALLVIAARMRQQEVKSFLLLFFKKEDLPFLSFRPRTEKGRRTFRYRRPS
jgi:hypothetical protein